MIQNATVLLRAPCENDYSTLTELRNDAALQTQLLSVPRPNTIARVQEWVAEKVMNPDTLFFVIADEKSNRCLGFIQITNIHWIHRTGWLGLALSEPARGQGFGFDAISLCEKFAFDQFGLRKISLEVLSTNDVARHVYSKMHYREIGVLESHVYFDGEFHDVVLMEKMLSQQENRKPWWRLTSPHSG